jgi:integrase
VRTKNRRAGVTFLLNIPDLLAAVADWDAYVRTFAGPDDVWYAPVAWLNTAEPLKQRQLTAQKSTDSTPHRGQALRHALKGLFDLAGLPYMHPHLFRHGHALYGLKQATTLEEFKAVSMNLMHANMGITDGVYGMLSATDVKTVRERLGQTTQEADPISTIVLDQLAVQLLQRLPQLKDGQP